MFTGIVAGRGRVASIEGETIGVVLPSIDGLEIGGSVAIDGVCLTATSVGQSVTFDVIEETRRRTTLAGLSVGDEVNVERALRIGDEIGGHLLSGHIMATARIESIHDQNYTIRCPPALAAYIHEKGFIAVDGISLTVGEVDGEGGFTVHIIPETLRLTTLGLKTNGDRVNIEIDAMTQAVVETVQRVMAQREGTE